MAAIEIWNSAAVVNGYIRLSGNIQTAQITGVRCIDALDVEFYDGDNYRDDFTSGGSINNISAILVGSSGTGPATDDYVISTANGVTRSSVTTSGANTYIKTATDAAMHVAPRNEQKKRTLLRFWSGPFSTNTGTGNVLASCWADEFHGFSPTTYSFI